MIIKLKYYIVLIGLCSLSNVVNAQLAKNRARKLYNDYAYADAIEIYSRYIKRHRSDFSSILNLATCYYKTQELESAKHWYSKAIHSDSTKREHLLYYAQTLEQFKEYDKAKEFYEAYSNKVALDWRSKRRVAGFQNLQKFYRDSARYTLSHFPYNSTSNDYAPVIYKKGIVFASDKPSKPGGVQRSYAWNNGGYFDLYIHENGSHLIFPFDNDEIINSPFHEAGCSFANSYHTIFFTSNNIVHGKKEFGYGNLNRLKIFQSELVDGKWSTPQELPFNHEDYSFGDPFYHEPTKALFFTSDMSGGFGGMDLYVSFFEHGKWSSPQNLGSKVNTEGNERSPFYANEEKFYFASNGHEGLGGLDIYQTFLNIEEMTFDDVENVGYPVNTEKDDFGLVLEENGLDGYFASRRNGGTGGDDIYKLSIIKKEDIKVKGIVFYFGKNDQSGKGIPLAGAQVKVYDQRTGKIVSEIVTEKDGTFNAKLKPGSIYTITAGKGTLMADSFVANLKNNNELPTIELSLFDLD